jgi:hypothetical protein
VNTDRKLMAGNGIPFLSIPTNDAFHNYRLRTTPDSIYLFIDGVGRGAAILGDTLFGAGAPTVYFGDGTTAAGSQARIGVVRYSYPVSTTSVAEIAGGSGRPLRIAPLAPVTRDGVGLTILAGSPDPVGIRVLDLAGRTVRDLGDAIAGRGARFAHWDGNGDAGRAAPAGVYFAVASGQRQRAACRFILLRGVGEVQDRESG